MAFFWHGRVGQMTMAGNRTTGSSLMAAMVSGVMYRARWTAHSSFCSRRITADEPDDGVVVGEDADDLSPALDFAVEPFEAVGGVDLGLVVDGKAHVGEHVGLGFVHEESELWQLGPEMVGDPAPLGLSGVCAVLSEGGRHEGGDDAPAALCGVGERLRMVWTRQRCQVAFISLATAALMLSWASETTSLTPRRPRRRSLRRNSVQNVSASDGPMSMPNASRRPSAFTPTATITATETMRWLRQTLT
jgi:hypothetical protein